MKSRTGGIPSSGVVGIMCSSSVDGLNHLLRVAVEVGNRHIGDVLGAAPRRLEPVPGDYVQRQSPGPLGHCARLFLLLQQPKTAVRS